MNIKTATMKDIDTVHMHLADKTHAIMVLGETKLYTQFESKVMHDELYEDWELFSHCKVAVMRRLGLEV